jgi:hypothetical protein
MTKRLSKGEVVVGILVQYRQYDETLVEGVVSKLGEREEGDFGFYLTSGEVYAHNMWGEVPVYLSEEDSPQTEEEYTGKSVSYYKVDITNPTTVKEPYTVECNDVIEALGMNYAEGNAFKSIWRRCAARKLGKSKKGYGSGLYDAEKGVFFCERILIQAEEEEGLKDE